MICVSNETVSEQKGKWVLRYVVLFSSRRLRPVILIGGWGLSAVCLGPIWTSGMALLHTTWLTVNGELTFTSEKNIFSMLELG